MEKLQELLDRAKTWPVEAQDELVELGREIEGEIKGEYHATPEELCGIDRGLRAADGGKFAAEAHIERALAKFRIA
ncbi:MAG: hypothetical protein AAB555_00805 [Patescibacteria group bacterium]